MKRSFDLTAALVGLLLFSPVFLVVLFLVWRHDRKSPFYFGERAGRDGQPFRMVKIRSMVSGADKSGVESTSATDMRITPVGHFVRKWKIDELSQLWNVVRGEMSLVGPRPNTLREVSTYTPFERQLLSVRPGITDLSSIVFSDEGAILAGSIDPDADYNRLIRPWKSRLGLFYVRHANPVLDLRLIWLTVVAILHKPKALEGVAEILRHRGAPAELLAVAARSTPLQSTPGTLP